MKVGVRINNSDLSSLFKKTRAMADSLSGAQSNRLRQKQLDLIDQAIYGGLGRAPSLASRFSKTRQNTAPGNPSGGTPVKTGKLQRALTVKGASYSRYSRSIRGKNEVQVSLSVDPRGHRGFRYFPWVENRYGFFGYETSQGPFVTTTMPSLAKKCAELLKAALRDAKR